MRANVLKRVLTAKATVFAGLAMIVALVLGMATTALAGTGVGARFDLGKINTVNAVSTLVGSVAGPTLRVDNDSTGAGATALDLQVEPGKPPMTVNSNAKVSNLNADQLDGFDQSQFVRSRVYFRASPFSFGTRQLQATSLPSEGTFPIRFLDMSCDPGDLLLSGGAADIDPNTRTLESRPSSNLAKWTVKIQNDNDEFSADQFRVFVVCADQQ